MADSRAFTGIIDLKMSPDGDLVIENGDLALVTGEDWFIQETNKIIRTNNPDWEFHPDVGASLEDFAGLPNTRETARAIEERLHDKITQDSIHIPGKLSVRAVPITVDEIAIYINLDIEGQAVEVSRKVFEFSDGIVRNPETGELPDVQSTVQSTVRPTNPYLNRIK